MELEDERLGVFQTLCGNENDNPLSLQAFFNSEKRFHR